MLHMRKTLLFSFLLYFVCCSCLCAKLLTIYKTTKHSARHFPHNAVPKGSFAFHGLKWNWQLCAFLWKHRLHQAFYRHAAGGADAHVDGPPLCLVANGELCQSHAFACHGGDESHHVVDRCEVALGDWCHGSTVPAQISHDEVGAWDFVCGSHFFSCIFFIVLQSYQCYVLNNCPTQLIRFKITILCLTQLLVDAISYPRFSWLMCERCCMGQAAVERFAHH